MIDLLSVLEHTSSPMVEYFSGNCIFGRWNREKNTNYCRIVNIQPSNRVVRSITGNVYDACFSLVCMQLRLARAL